MLAEDFKMCRVTCFGWGKSGTDKKDTGTIPEESWRDQCHDGRETQEWGTIQANENENLNLNISIPVPSQYITIIHCTCLDIGENLCKGWNYAKPCYIQFVL